MTDERNTVYIRRMLRFKASDNKKEHSHRRKKVSGGSISSASGDDSNEGRGSIDGGTVLQERRNRMRAEDEQLYRRGVELAHGKQK